MNQAALNSNQALARYDEELRQALEFDLGGDSSAEQSRPQIRSGRNISSLPYGGVSDTSIMQDESSRALVRIKSSEARMNDEYDESICVSRGEASFSHPTPPRSALVFPASAIGTPGIDAAGQLASMQAKLNQRLGPEFISTRQGPGGTRLSYLEGWKAIELANEVFGFNGWSSSITRMDVDFLDEAEGRKWNVGVSVVMRITLRDGTFHEDIGYGHCENVKMKHQALEKARKEASTDALKRALRTFGRMLGNCLYDKKFVDTASKLKTAPTKYDLTSLKRNCDVSTDVAAPAQAPSAAASTSRPSPVTPQSNQQKISPSQSAERMEANGATAISSERIAKASSVVRDQHSNVDKPQASAALSREERKAIAAAKQAAIRSKKEEEKAKRDPLPTKTMQRNPTSDAPEKKSTPNSQDIENEFSELEYKNVDEYDLQLMEAVFDDEDDLLEEKYVEKAKDSVKLAPSSSMEDSGIGLADNFAPRQNSQRSNTAQGASMKTASKGRFMDSSSPPQRVGRIDRNGPPSSSPKIPVRGRRLSMVGTTSTRAPQPPSSSQSLRSRNSRQSTNDQVASNHARNQVVAGKRFSASGTGDHSVQIKRPRPSPY